ncbi:putative aminopeptidase FrvX [Clostridium acetobutylicum]|uniref:Endoglucanase, aminopeptidase M42 family n=1 Tax=Clostridium acetobutylicum (strain ATCC 824 / DSM 792 / JCM 1419 / IAM 19013 / LMG 5710 / NBRC 13948 / NRRL B-527 / VKM B-1787 / 2291 / W) TaxID=272562 RepID=Q97L72_CLOAB|nr:MULTISPECIES: M42 family metallopeptidase [Clostridium]AAK78667.1 Endoglucanase, aminopeptidase M42 family [Clostridium acetobutylicum ATCC 824]ADZ19740.1 Endoglucanase, aminopeptidase M42 family [Clostridium acetobutylicum EA 2018]AEI33890.1 aminopeptidase M42 family endoglucanase [Clostridium acetobutylicum DSM 1731]AWV80386.1 aminopeptidase [Clostridium acetobutylicum]MBC2392575.1 M42 family metallopeptidase [Clostridium acetobutylicum]
MHNSKELTVFLQNLLQINSPSGYTHDVVSYIEKEFCKLGVHYKITNKGNIMATLPGKNSSFERTISAHLDTLGAMVKEIKSNGTLSLTPIGGYMMNSIEGENCNIMTLDDKKYTGTIQSTKPSVHIHNDAKELKRIPENMEVVIDEKVFSKEDVEALGINVGDFICFDPRIKFTDSGFIKSRHLDDKASAAIMLYAIKHFIDNNIELKYTTNFYFSTYEEVGHGASNLPQNTKELLCIDMGAPGKGQNSSEFATCICAKDSSGPYDYAFRKRLVDICKNKNIPYRIDTYPYYGSDASAALKSGYDIKTALIGTGVYASHGYERTHLDGMLATLDLLINYCTSE